MKSNGSLNSRRWTALRRKPKRSENDARPRKTDNPTTAGIDEGNRDKAK
jgi:hypothetical protein